MTTPWPGGPAGLRAPGPSQVRRAGTPQNALPIVVTVGSSVQFSSAADTIPTSATLIGSIDAQNQPASWWFTYGLTPQMGTTTASASAGASALPRSITATLTGLAHGRTYYFAAVGNAGGNTVVGAVLSFLYDAPQVPSSTATVVPNSAPSSLTIPHLAWPFTIVSGTPHAQQGALITSSDGAKVVQQDSDGDVLACVKAIVNCQVGEWPQNPGFGIGDPTFAQVDLDEQGKPQIDALSVASTVTRWEPRASLSEVLAATVGDQTGGAWTLELEAAASS